MFLWCSWMDEWAFVQCWERLCSSLIIGSTLIAVIADMFGSCIPLQFVLLLHITNKLFESRLRMLLWIFACRAISDSAWHFAARSAQIPCHRGRSPFQLLCKNRLYAGSSSQARHTHTYVLTHSHGHTNTYIYERLCACTTNQRHSRRQFCLTASFSAQVITRIDYRS